MDQPVTEPGEIEIPTNVLPEEAPAEPVEEVAETPEGGEPVEQPETPEEEATEQTTAKEDEYAKLPEWAKQRMHKLAEGKRKAEQDAEAAKAEAATAKQQAEANETAALAEEAEKVSEALTWMQGNRSQFMAEVVRRYPSLSEEQAAEMYVQQTQELSAKALGLTSKVMRKMASGSSKGTQNVPTPATKPATKPALTAKPKLQPTSIVPGGAGGGGTTIRTVQQKPKVAELLKGKGGSEDRGTIDEVMGNFTSGRLTG